ncbi:MAG TPA: peptidoglycan-associated lipoprotein Pal [Gammaproteobacteria bacterium]|nr:peptidoglycan-associated lipoprotein Pal [Gammaproteobacteria bacterium]
MLCYAIVAASIILSGGCAPSSTKPDGVSVGPSGSSSASPSGSDNKSAGEGRTGATRESNVPSTSSSLDQLKAGKPPITSSSSPLKDVLFEFDSYDLRGTARDVLRGNAEWLKSNPSARIEVEGHCDERGTSEYNLALGAKRSQTAKDYLVSLGISPERISTISYGEEIPVCTEPNENCWRQNRRARFVVVPSRPAS